MYKRKHWSSGEVRQNTKVNRNRFSFSERYVIYRGSRQHLKGEERLVGHAGLKEEHRNMGLGKFG